MSERYKITLFNFVLLILLLIPYLVIILIDIPIIWKMLLTIIFILNGLIMYKREKPLSINKQIILIILLNITFSTSLAIISIQILLKNEIPNVIRIIFPIIFFIVVLKIYKRDFKILIFLGKRLWYNKVLRKEENRIEVELKKHESNSIEAGGRRKHIITYSYFMCKWKNFEDKKTYTFLSDFYNRSECPLKVGSKVIVYIDRKNPKRYYVDVKESIEKLNVEEEKKEKEENAKE